MAYSTLPYLLSVLSGPGLLVRLGHINDLSEPETGHTHSAQVGGSVERCSAVLLWEMRRG